MFFVRQNHITILVVFMRITQIRLPIHILVDFLRHVSLCIIRKFRSIAVGLGHFCDIAVLVIFIQRSVSACAVFDHAVLLVVFIPSYFGENRVNTVIGRARNLNDPAVLVVFIVGFYGIEGFFDRFMRIAEHKVLQILRCLGMILDGQKGIVRLLRFAVLQELHGLLERFLGLSLLLGFRAPRKNGRAQQQAKRQSQKFFHVFLLFE